MIKRRIIRSIVPAMACAALLLAGCSQEGADWKQASLANTPEAYQLFLQQHPHSADAAQAQARLQQLTEQRDWQLASAADTRDAYQQFVTKHPDSKWTQEARIRIENFAQGGVSGGAGVSASTASAQPTTPVTTAATTAAATTTATTASAAAGTSVGSTVASPPPAPTAAAPPAPTPAAHATVARKAAARAHSRRLAARHTRGATLARAHKAHPAGRLVQLGAFRSKARAESEWRELAARFSMLRPLTPRYVAVRERKGRFYRLQVRLSSAHAASGLCATLKHHDRPCVRVNA